MTQLEQAKRGSATTQMLAVSEAEGVHIDDLIADVAAGRTVIPANIHRNNVNPMGVGRNLRVKVNANIGTSSDHADLPTELEKLKLAVEAGADTVMDLST